MDLLTRVKSLSTSTAIPASISVDLSHGAAQSEQLETIDVFKDYFRIDIKQICFAEQQMHWEGYVPLLYAAVDYDFGNRHVVSSLIAGPKSFARNFDYDKKGIARSELTVAGPNPFVGGDVGITILLYRIPRSSKYAPNMLQLLEDLSSSQVGSQSRRTAEDGIGGILLDGVQAIISQNESLPVLVHRVEINTSSIDGFQPFVRALLSCTTREPLSLNENCLWTEGRKYTSSDYLVFEISKIRQRQDYETLPFYSLAQEACEVATRGNSGNQTAQGLLIAFYNSMLKSNELTIQDRERLFADAIQRVQQRQLSSTTLGEIKKPTDELKRSLELIENSLPGRDAVSKSSANESDGIVRHWVDDSEARRVDLLFATSREKSTEPATYFSGERSKEMTYGSLRIRVPNERNIGEVNLPFQLKFFNITLYRQKENPRLHFILQSCEELPKGDWLQTIRSSGNSQALVFVHGFNVSFLEGAFRCAQIVWDIGYTGIPILFSWASRGEIADYFYDQVSARLAGDGFPSLLQDLHSAGVTKVHILAHSMGNTAVLGALSRTEVHGGFGIGELMMAAPDVDRDEYVKMVGQAGAISEGVTLYASSKDRALAVSKRLAGNIPRAGDVLDYGPILVDKVDAIDASSLGEDIFGLNHGTFASNKSILNDVKRLLQDGTRPPPKRLVELRGMPEGATPSRWWRYVF